MEIRTPARNYIRRWYRQSGKRIDRSGMICGRLLFQHWLGMWHGRHWWQALCDCGRTCEVQWRPNDVKSCGCQKEEKDRQRDFRTQRADGGWGLKTEKRLKLADGRTVTVTELARLAGVHKRVMARRVALWPEQRWLEPPHYVGKRDRRELIDRKNRERQTPRPQPWARAIMQQINADGRAYRKVKHER